MAFVLVGRQLAHYQLTGPLGSGAMSEVYLARDTRLDKEVAVKVILDSVARKPELVQRFEREARAAGRLDHPHMARVYFFGQTDEDAPFYAMELIDGWSLADVIEARLRFRVDQVLSLLAQCANGLQAALDAGIVHRDIKPANLMVNRAGVLKLVDFGLAKLSDDKSLTRTGTMLGTPYYMAPEIVRGDGGDWRSDLYSLGVTFFHLLCGFPPYEAETPYGVMMRHINHPVPDLCREHPRLPEGLSALLTAMLNKDAASRPVSYAAVQAEAMRLGRELPPADLMARIAWCRSESRNTIDQGGRCSSCQKPFSGADRPARFHVDIVGWTKNGADAEIAAYIGKAVGRPPEVVAPLLQALPFRAAFRSPRDRARKIQRSFFDMGADVQLVPADEHPGGLDATTTELTFRPYWPPEAGPVETATGGRVGAVTDARSLRLRALPALKAARPSRPTLLILALLMVCAALVFALLRQRRAEPTPEPVAVVETPRVRAPIPAAVEPEPSAWDGTFDAQDVAAREEATAQGETDAINEAAAGAETAGGQPAESDVTEAAPPRDEPLPRSDRFDATNRSRAPSAVAAGALAVLEEQARTIDGELGLRTRRLPLAFTNDLLVDGRGVRRWPAAAYAPVLEFPLGGAVGPHDAPFTPAARLLYGRAAIRQAGGASVPPWLLVGLSLVLEQGQSTTASVADLISRTPTAPSALNVRLGENPADTERVLRAFGSWLIKEHGWAGTGRALEAMRRGSNLDAAFVQGFGESLAELESSWLAIATGAE